MRNMRESYNQLAAAQASLMENVQAIKDAHILGFSYDGIIFLEGYEPRGAFGIIAERQYILEVRDNQDTIIPKMSKTDYPYLEVFEMRNGNTTTQGISSWMSGSTTLREVIIPNLANTGYIGYVSNFFDNMTELRVLDLQYSNKNLLFSSGCFTGSNKLIDLIIGSNLGSSYSISSWYPTEAILDNSTSLLTQADLDLGFTSNREKLLYNIREHIAANLPDRTDDTPFTLTFNQTLRNAFDQATDDAFAAKNWDIAPARS